MLSFEGGPAAGTVLACKRAPQFLRLVQSESGEWDALDQLNDEPEAGEKIVVYVLVSYKGQVHICSRTKGNDTSGWYAWASYKVVAEQPGDDIARDTAKWREWCVDAQKASEVESDSP